MSSFAGRLASKVGLDGPCEERSRLSVDTDLNGVFALLKNERRRLVIREAAALDRGESIALGDLAERIAAVQTMSTPDEVDATARKRVYVALYQVHLEKLDAAGAVRYDERGVRVRRGDHTAAFKRIIDEVHGLIGAEGSP